MKIPGLDEALGHLYTFQEDMQALLERMAGGIDNINEKLETLIEQGLPTEAGEPVCGDWPAPCNHDPAHDKEAPDAEH